MQIVVKGGFHTDGPLLWLAVPARIAVPGHDIDMFTTLSTGITPVLPVDAQLVIVLLMFVGRVGPLTVASALALRQKQQRHTLPEERMIVG